jgi:anaphase-promoting complex subunit 8
VHVTCIPMAHALNPEHADSEAQFEIIRADDPERIDGLDIYSNLLYLSNNRLKLSNLAHELSKVDKDRPEVCCVVGESRSCFIPSYTD